MPQPSGMMNDSGVIVTIGIQNVLDRCAIVLPLGTSATFDKVLGCQQVCTGIFDTIMPLLLACISENSYVTFIAAEGMVDGVIPHRNDYIPTDNPGTRSGVPMPSQVAGLLAFYEDPDDATPGSRMRVGKNFLPGISTNDVEGDHLDDALLSAMQALSEALVSGFMDSASNEWYRVLAAPKPRTPGTALKRIAAHNERGYVCTQRRRLIPR